MRNILYHGTGSWGRIERDGFLSPSGGERVFCEQSGSKASCGGVYLGREPAYPAYIADRAARRGSLERTVIAVNVPEDLLEADEDILVACVTEKLKIAGCDIPRWSALALDGRIMAYRRTYRAQVIDLVAAEIGPAKHSDLHVLESGIDAIVDRIGGPWRPLWETEAAINALTDNYRAPASKAWIAASDRRALATCRTFARVGRDPGTEILGAVTAVFREDSRQEETMVALRVQGDFPRDAVTEVLRGLDEAACNWDTVLSYHPDVVRAAAGFGICLRNPAETEGLSMAV